MMVASITAIAISHLLEEAVLNCGGEELSEGAAAMTNQKLALRWVAEAAQGTSQQAMVSLCKGHGAGPDMRLAVFIEASRMPNIDKLMQPKTKVIGLDA
jgi:hypothetical protein